VSPDTRNYSPFAGFLTANFLNLVLVPANNVPLKIWKCFDNLPAQAWFYTADKRIALTGKGRYLRLLSISPVSDRHYLDRTMRRSDGRASNKWKPGANVSMHYGQYQSDLDDDPDQILVYFKYRNGHIGPNLESCLLLHLSLVL
jgi:hypothetical protein